MRINQAGLSLIELLITLGVTSILMSVAVPAFTNFTVRNHSIAEISNLKADLQFARSEAAKFGVATRLCVGNSTGCQPTWGTDWQKGWAVIVNGTSNVLRVHPELKGSGAIASLDNVTNTASVDFNRYGFTTPRVFRLCNELNHAKAILLSRTGRVRYAKDTDSPANGLIDDENNNDISCP